MATRPNMQRPRRAATFALLALALAATACGPKTSTSATLTRVAHVMVTLKEFSIAPAVMAAPAGPPVMLMIQNEGQGPHAIAVEAGGHTYQTAMIAAGASATLNLPGLPKGSYQVWCTVPGHKDAGMIATLAVGITADAAGSASNAMSGMGSGMSNMSAQQMAVMHAAGIKAFPATTQGQGNQILKPELEGGWKVFHLVAEQVRWEVSPGQFVDAFAYNDQIPGPQLRIHRGDRVKVIVSNALPQPTAVHFHGLTVPNAMDGVPGITQDPIMPGEQFTYAFMVTDQPGTYMYHSHFNSAEQVGLGLYGAFLIEPKGTPAWDVEYTEFLNDGPLGYTINGKGFPATAPLTASYGQKVLIRMLDVGEMTHTMHLHGYHFPIVSQDGYALTTPETVDTIVIAPGETIDGLVTANQLGVWAFHCHVLGHAEGPSGMFGMVTAFIVQK